MGAPFDDEPGGSPRPDWGRVDVTSRAGSNSGAVDVGLGDPTRWGATENLIVSQNGVLAWTQQLVRAQAADNYPRNWQIIGTIEADAAVWSQATSLGNWFALLEIQFGVGQAMLTHRINLRALIDLAVPPALFATFNTWYVPVPIGNSRVIFPWVLPGGVLARALSVRMAILTELDPESPPFSLPQTFQVTALLAPYSAGGEL